MPFKNIVKALLEVKHTVIDKLSIEDDSLVIDVYPTKSFRHRCGLCGHRGTFYDYGNGKGPRLWRSTDFEGHKVFLRYSTYRVYCPHCKAVHSCKVPWAAHGSRFTHKFEEVTTWFALQMNKSATSSYMRIAWLQFFQDIEARTGPRCPRVRGLLRRLIPAPDRLFAELPRGFQNSQAGQARCRGSMRAANGRGRPSKSDYRERLVLSLSYHKAAKITIHFFLAAGQSTPKVLPCSAGRYRLPEALRGRPGAARCPEPAVEKR